MSNTSMFAACTLGKIQADLREVLVSKQNVAAQVVLFISLSPIREGIGTKKLEVGWIIIHESWIITADKVKGASHGIDHSLMKSILHRSNFNFPGRSQGLFALVFLTRYLDLFTNFISLYNTAMKIFFLVSSIGTVYLMFLKFKATYDHNHDTFRWVFFEIVWKVSH